MPQKSGALQREETRYVFEVPVPAAVGNAAVTVVNASDRGLQIEHPEPLRVSSVCRISIALPAMTDRVEIEGQIAWTQLLKSREGNGAAYVSGVKLEGTAENAAMIRMVIAAYPARRDEGALERRGENRPVMRLIKTHKVVDADRLLLIRQVNERLSLAPEEMKVLAGRARSALSIRVASVVHSDNELAVWEYLQHVVSLDDIHEALS